MIDDPDELPESLHEAAERLARGEGPDAVLRDVQAAAYDAGRRTRWRIVTPRGAALEVETSALTDEERAGLNLGAARLPPARQELAWSPVARACFYAVAFLVGATVATWTLR